MAFDHSVCSMYVLGQNKYNDFYAFEKYLQAQFRHRGNSPQELFTVLLGILMYEVTVVIIDLSISLGIVRLKWGTVSVALYSGLRNFW